MADPNLLSSEREIAHNSVAVLGAVAASAGVVVALLANFGVHVDAANVVEVAGVVGAIVTTLSKAIDSINNAIVPKAGAVSVVPAVLSSTLAPAAVEPTVPASSVVA